MSNKFAVFEDDFFGARTFTATQADNAGWLIADTSAAGAPTYALVDGSASGEIALDMAADVEVENLCLYMGDILQHDIDNIKRMEIWIKQNQATIDSTTTLTFGLAGDRNDAPDSVAQSAFFALQGANTITVECDDGTNETAATATGKSLTNAYQVMEISFNDGGKSDIRFFVDGQPVAQGTTFSMAAYGGSLQPFFQIQKTSDANTDGMTIDYVKVWGTRS